MTFTSGHSSKAYDLGMDSSLPSSYLETSALTVEDLLKKNALLEQELAEMRQFWRKETLMLVEECCEVKYSLQKTNLLGSLRGNDKLTRFYTGLNTYTLYQSTFNFVSIGQNPDRRHALSLEEQYLLTLMKLRLNLKEEDLAYRFGIGSSSVSRYFQKWVNIMFVRLTPMVIRWPTRDEITKAMPNCFVDNGFKNCVGIIDCFELPLNVPSNLLDKVSVFSPYKGRHTAKYLISILPHGSVNFISCGYGGRTSDKFIVEDCGILNNIRNGDLILADRGFTVAEAVGLHGGQLKTPAFKENRPQLTKKEIADSRTIANVRIHVERVIGVLKLKFNILCGPVNILHATPNSQGFNFFDKVVKVCCCLHNVNPGVVPLE